MSTQPLSPLSISRRQSAGFSLVEVTLAVLVVAVGLLSVMALFPDGLRTGKKATDETYAAFFAEEVMNGIKANVLPELAGFDGLEGVQLEAPNFGMWKNNGQDVIVEVTPNEEIYVNKYEIEIAGGSEPDVVDHALRFRLKIAPVAGLNNTK